MNTFETGIRPEPLLAAKHAYQNLLAGGINATDRELARNGQYRTFLMAGLAIMRMGGAGAVADARSFIVASVPDSDPQHFDRLWDGLLSD